VYRLIYLIIMLLFILMITITNLKVCFYFHCKPLIHLLSIK